MRNGVSRDSGECLHYTADDRPKTARTRRTTRQPNNRKAVRNNSLSGSAKSVTTLKWWRWGTTSGRTIAGGAVLRPCLPHRRGLADELASLVGADREHERCREARSMAQRTHRARRRRVEPQVDVHRRQKQRLQIEHAADRHRAADRLRLCRVRPWAGKQAGHEMSSGRMTGEQQPLGRNAVSRAVGAKPPDGFARLLDDARNPDRGAQVVVHHGDADPALDPRIGDERMVTLVERAPVAAVDEQERAARLARREQVDGLSWPRPIAHVQARLEALARSRAVGGPAREPLRVIRERRPVVVLALDEFRRERAHPCAAGAPTRTLSSPSDSMRPTIVSPATTAATPAGVPVNIRSPGSSS